MAAKKKKSTAKSAKPRKKKAPSPPHGKEDDLLDMEQAIALLKTTRPTFYRWLRSGKIKGMKVGRQWRFYREEIDRFLKGEEPQIELTADIRPFLKSLEDRLAELGTRDLTPAEAGTIVRAVNAMIRLGIAMGASDIHLAPHMGEESGEGARAFLRYRVDGVLHAFTEVDVRLLPALVDRWKVMSTCDRNEKVRPQDGRILIDLTGEDRGVEIRVSVLPTGLGESLTARILDPGAGVKYLSLDRIHFPSLVREKYERWLHAPYGVIVVTGPTGCGKTTTLYAGLKSIADPGIKIITIEDPVEYYLPWMVQTQVRPQHNVGFLSNLRAALRSDPDVVFVGEIRDPETLISAQQVALTGHLVLTALHAPEAVKALVRMVKVGKDPNMLAESVKLVLAQRLFRTLCPDCGVVSAPATALVRRAEEEARAGGLDWDSIPKRFRGAKGCPRCAHTGYRGRDVIAEALEVTPEIAGALRHESTIDELLAIAVGQGMVTLAADGVRRACLGETTLDEVMRVLGLR
jgi:excisionase family DNA binding protein